MAAKIRESEVERAIRKYAESKGCLFLKLAGRNQRGQPDRLVLRNGKALFLEIKRPGEKPEALQLWWMKKLRMQGFKAEWCDSSDDGNAIITLCLL